MEYKLITVERRTGTMMPKLCLFLLGFLLIAELRRHQILSGTGPTIAAALYGVLGLLGLLSREVCVFSGSPRSMNTERWIVDARVRATPINIETVRWVRSRWSGGKAFLELGPDGSSGAIEVQTTQLGAREFSSRLDVERRMNEVRASIAMLLDIEDGGWESFFGSATRQ
ncbi:hypothetical protein [Burkholderia sp. PAMC 26561]|uniref:hypothetical protein n=1 Tax=Burkholderia sp. PAMC 26561 TaxID=1795043 RepID=UPI000A912716|nr:hypothetical protein [Burkholderia sp. PAMC 26561]